MRRLHNYRDKESDDDNDDGNDEVIPSDGETLPGTLPVWQIVHCKYALSVNTTMCIDELCHAQIMFENIKDVFLAIDKWQAC